MHQFITYLFGPTNFSPFLITEPQFMVCIFDVLSNCYTSASHLHSSAPS